MSEFRITRIFCTIAFVILTCRCNSQQESIKFDFEHISVAVQKKGTHVWGTSPVIGKDGRVHLYVAEWPIPENKKEHFSGFFKSSEIAHYVGDTPEGPFEFVRIAVPDQDGTLNAPHNPNINFIDGRYVLCFIVNENDDRTKQRIIMYVADDLNDNWRPAKGAEPDGTILRRPDDTNIWNQNSKRGVSNPSLMKYKGEYLLYFKSAIPEPEEDPNDFYNREFGYGVATSKTLEGPYQIYPKRVTSKEIELEDSFTFCYGDMLYMISRDIASALGDKEGGLLWKSDDGFNFPVEETQRAFESLSSYVGEEALEGAKTYRGSLKGQLERPQLLIIDGKPAYMYVATGINTNDGYGSCSHVFKITME